MAEDQSAAQGSGLYGTLASWGGGAWNYAASTINRCLFGIKVLQFLAARETAKPQNDTRMMEILV